MSSSQWIDVDPTPGSDLHECRVQADALAALDAKAPCTMLRERSRRPVLAAVSSAMRPDTPSTISSIRA